MWAILTTVGTVLIALPDAGNRVFSISPGHGPAPMDLAGAVLLTAAWLILDLWTWRRRGALRSLNRRALWLLLFLAAAGVALIAWSVSQDEGMWWLLGAGMVGAAQLGAAVAAARSTSGQVSSA